MVNDTGESDLLRWIPLLPLLAAVLHGVLIGVVRRSLAPNLVAAISCGAVVLVGATRLYGRRVRHRTG